MAAAEAGTAPSGENMKRNRHFEVLGGCPEWIIDWIAIRLVFRRRTPDQHAAQTFFGAALEFLHSFVDIFQRHGAGPDQALGVVTAIFAGPIIKRFEAGVAEFGIVESKQQHAHRGVENLAANSITILFLESFGGVPHTAGRSVKTAL